MMLMLNLEQEEKTMPKTVNYCQVNNCETRCHGLGYCVRHYKQFTRHGKIFTSVYEARKAIIEGDVAKLPLGVNAKDGYATVDLEYSYLEDYKWVLVDGYAKSAGGKRGIPKGLHRFILGDVPGMEIDHKNGIKLDCRKSNLRHCTHAENTRNLSVGRTNTSGYKGVSFHKAANKFAARVTYNYKNIHIGLFNTAEEASVAYEKKAKELFGKFNRSTN